MYDRQLPIKESESIIKDILQYGEKTPVSSIYECCLTMNNVTYHLNILIASKKKILVLDSFYIEHCSGKNRPITEYDTLQVLTELLLKWFRVIKNNNVMGADCDDTRN